jgi:hypothetical protein
MRKAKIVIFTVFTVILFLLSTSTYVTAALDSRTYMILNSNVYDEWPWANVNADPQDAGGQYNNWSWTIDIDNGDDIEIKTTCNYNNYYTTTGEGYHYFFVMATYVYGLDIRGDHGYDDFTTHDTGDSGSTTIRVSFGNVAEGAVINMFWYVQAINKEQNPDVDDDFDNTGTIYLT